MLAGTELLGEQRPVHTRRPTVVIEIALSLRGLELSVDVELLVDVADLVARDAGHALDEVGARIFGIAEHHHVAALHVVVGDDLLVQHRQPDAVMELVDEDEVADQQRRHHGPRRDLERLEQKAAQQEDDEDDREQASGPIQPPGLLQQLLAGRFDVAIDAADALRSQRLAPLGITGDQRIGRRAAGRREMEALGQPVQQRDRGQDEQQQCEVAAPVAGVPAAQVGHQGRVQNTGQSTHRGGFQGWRNGISRRPAGWRGRLLAAPRPSRSASCASCRPFAFPAACACG
mmetsp:Transcript_48730/g.118722  ORF Transcript_48730/g.118722 Transcript_48730/m.118722 type:complete len:288 (+) Transcript_48730:521-1384(+)